MEYINDVTNEFSHKVLKLLKFVYLYFQKLSNQLQRIFAYPILLKLSSLIRQILILYIELLKLSKTYIYFQISIYSLKTLFNIYLTKFCILLCIHWWKYLYFALLYIILIPTSNVSIIKTIYCQIQLWMPTKNILMYN